MAITTSSASSMSRVSEYLSGALLTIARGLSSFTPRARATGPAHRSRWNGRKGSWSDRCSPGITRSMPSARASPLALGNANGWRPRRTTPSTRSCLPTRCVTSAITGVRSPARARSSQSFVRWVRDRRRLMELQRTVESQLRATLETYHPAVARPWEGKTRSALRILRIMADRGSVVHLYFRLLPE